MTGGGEGAAADLAGSMAREYAEAPVRRRMMSCMDPPTALPQKMDQAAWTEYQASVTAAACSSPDDNAVLCSARYRTRRVLIPAVMTAASVFVCTVGMTCLLFGASCKSKGSLNVSCMAQPKN